MAKKIIRQVNAPASAELSHLPSWLAAIYQVRGINSAEDLDYHLAKLLPWHGLLHITDAATLLAQHLQQQHKILVIGDYDADGATSTALAVSALRDFGAEQVEYLVPDRFKDGYGLSVSVVEKAKGLAPQLIITVDNGIANHAGVAAARAAGIDVLITDHHLAASTLPEASVIVNPNQPHDEFASKALAGVGVIFYVMLALRSHLKTSGWFAALDRAVPSMATYLDLVAVGTVADLVPLDRNNRILVEQGLRRMRAGQMRPGIAALLQVSHRETTRVVASDLGFAVGPRLNAAGRLDDMALGIGCLLASSSAIALPIAEQLSQLNDERRVIEADMQAQAFAALDQLQLQANKLPIGISLFNPSWHQGVVGILAARVKDQYHRPVIAFAPGEHDELKGSARSIAGLHLRDLLQVLDLRYPGLMLKYGGHAMAAGLSIARDNFPEFSRCFDELARELIDPTALNQQIYSAGALPSTLINYQTAQQLRYAGPWGQQFSEPLFDDEFEVLDQQLVAGKHLKLLLSQPAHDNHWQAMAFNVDLDQWPNHRCRRVHLAYRLDLNFYNGLERLQLIVEELIALSEV